MAWTTGDLVGPPARVVSTPRGPVEVAERGRGTPIVLLHGSPGGLDGAMAMSQALPLQRTRAIMLSRPGYLGTPLSTGPTIDEQADLVVGVLDALGIERAAVMSLSGGGPCGYRAAVRHPGRIAAHVAVSALSGRYHEPPQNRADRLILHTRAGGMFLRWMARRHPLDLAHNVLASEGALDPGVLRSEVRRLAVDPRQLDFIRAISRTAVDAGRRRPGYRNDMAQFARIDSLELDRTRVPTLVVHGDADADAPLSHALSAIEQIPGCASLIMPGGTHVAFYVHPHAETAQQRAVSFMESALGS